MATPWKMIARRILWHALRRRDPAEVSLMDHLMRLFKRMRVACVLDVGAHYGEYGVSLRKAGYRGQIISFEPLPSSFEVLRQAASGDPLWAVHNLALGAKSSTASINVSMHTAFSSFRKPTASAAASFPNIQADARQDVEVRRLEPSSSARRHS